MWVTISKSKGCRSGHWGIAVVVLVTTTTVSLILYLSLFLPGTKLVFYFLLSWKCDAVTKYQTTSHYDADHENFRAQDQCLWGNNNTAKTKISWLLRFFQIQCKFNVSKEVSQWKRPQLQRLLHFQMPRSEYISISKKRYYSLCL